ncbi:MAG: sulfurtransferase TusA family protein, partial [Fibrobacter sp.]|nr:sulfurtransferase TusA family protein [Fibrobacter sp.]
MDKNPLLVWVENNRKKEGFGKSLVQLLGYACTDWIRRECSASLTGTDGLAWFLAKAPAEIPMGEWVQSPEEHA